MPYWFETKKLKFSKSQDKRIKLTDQEREEIKELYNEGIAIRKIARRFSDKCSRRLIQLIIFPERLKELYQKQKDEEHWKRYYDKDKNKNYMRKYRKHKIEVFGLSNKKT